MPGQKSPVPTQVCVCAHRDTYAQSINNRTCLGVFIKKNASCFLVPPPTSPSCPEGTTACILCAMKVNQPVHAFLFPHLCRCLSSLFILLCSARLPWGLKHPVALPRIPPLVLSLRISLSHCLTHVFSFPSSLSSDSFFFSSLSFLFFPLLFPSAVPRSQGRQPPPRKSPLRRAHLAIMRLLSEAADPRESPALKLPISLCWFSSPLSSAPRREKNPIKEIKTRHMEEQRAEAVSCLLFFIPIEENTGTLRGIRTGPQFLKSSA